MDPNAEIAQTILQQLGGSRFLAMTGAKLMRDGPALIVHLPASFRGPGAGAGHQIKITLNADDLYLIEQIKITKGSYKVSRVTLADGAYAEDLQRIFTEATGLDTHI
jgi:hypothetical protein